MIIRSSYGKIAKQQPAILNLTKNTTPHKIITMTVVKILDLLFDIASPSYYDVYHNIYTNRSVYLVE